VAAAFGYYEYQGFSMRNPFSWSQRQAVLTGPAGKGTGVILLRKYTMTASKIEIFMI
jgi:hypothetical protein